MSTDDEEFETDELDLDEEGSASVSDVGRVEWVAGSASDLGDE